MFKVRPIVAAIHPNMVEELKERKKMLEAVLGRNTKGGLTCFSELAALELKLMRLSGEKIMQEISKQTIPPIKKIVENGITQEYVPYEVYKKMFILVSALNKKKDQQQIKLEVIRLKGMKKNEINFTY